MSSNVIESLAIKIGVEAEGVENAFQKLAKGTEAVKGAFDRVADKINAVREHVGNASKAGGEKLNDLGKHADATGATFAEVGETVKHAFDPKTLKGFEVGLRQLAVPLAGIFSVGASFRSFLNEGEALDDFSKRLGVNAQQVDAWAHASRDAGGSAQGLKSALESFMKNTGQGADAFFALGKKIQGMSNFSARKTLEALGVSGDAQSVFLKHRENAEAVAKSYEKIATTAKQAETAKNFNLALRGLSDTFHGFAYDLFVLVTPALEGVLRLMKSVLGFIGEHAGLVKIALSALAVYMGTVWATTLAGAIKTVGGLSGVLKIATVQARALFATLAANPFAMIVTAVVAVCAVFEDLYTFAVGGRSVFGAFLETLGVAPKTIDKVREGLGLLVVVADQMVEVFKKDFQFLADLFDWILGDGTFEKVASSFIDAWKARLIEFPMAIAEYFRAPLEEAIQWATDKITSFLDMAKGFGNKVSSFFGFGDDDNDKPTPLSSTDFAQSVVAKMVSVPTVTSADNRQTVNVETHITTSADPEAVAGAVERGVGRGLSRTNSILVNANSGVKQKG